MDYQTKYSRLFQIHKASLDVILAQYTSKATASCMVHSRNSRRDRRGSKYALSRVARDMVQDCDSDQVQISYWSYGSSRSRGVAILLTPQAALHAAAWNEDRWKTRAIGISMHDMYILNEYAPNDWPERESLFDSLHDWNLPSGTSVLWRF